MLADCSQLYNNCLQNLHYCLQNLTLLECIVGMQTYCSHVGDFYSKIRTITAGCVHTTGLMVMQTLCDSLIINFTYCFIIVSNCLQSSNKTDLSMVLNTTASSMIWLYY